MRAKRQVEGLILDGQVLEEVKPKEREGHCLDRVSADLEARGVSPGRAAQLASQLSQGKSWERLSPEEYEALLDGASVTAAPEQGVAPTGEENVEQVREIERMMQAFAGELAKLDESLEVLSAYVRRMRESPVVKRPSSVRKTLH
jgi:hypothetical protein